MTVKELHEKLAKLIDKGHGDLDVLVDHSGDFYDIYPPSVEKNWESPHDGSVADVVTIYVDT